jgi:hypothetical protein
LLADLPQGRARRQEGAVQMNGEELLPLGELELVQGRHDLDAGVAHQDIEPPERGNRLRHAGLDLRLVTSMATPTACLPDASSSFAASAPS